MEKILLQNNFKHVETDLSPVGYIEHLIQKEDHKIIGICGASAAGKTEMAKELTSVLGKHNVTYINVDGYLKYTRDEMQAKGLTGFDVEARDMGKFYKDMEFLKSGKPIKRPLWDEEKQSVSNREETVMPGKYIILEDTIDFTNIADLTIFLFAPDSILINRRLRRDLKMSYWGEDQLKDYVTNVSLPSYKEKHWPVALKSRLVIDTSNNKIYNKSKK